MKLDFDLIPELVVLKCDLAPESLELLSRAELTPECATLSNRMTARMISLELCNGNSY
jgi:hypothetical protein